MKLIKLPFGLKENGILVHIEEAERGKKCNCFCPSCRSPLIAAKGDKKHSHFKHAIVNECENGLESAIHLAAKKLIIEKKQITLSEFVFAASAIDSRGIKHTVYKTVVDNGTVIHFDSVQEETELHGMRSDILAKKGNASIIIEIFYRHKVEDQKLAKIAKADISAIEINLSDLTSEDVMDWESLWLYLNDPIRIRWLHNAKGHLTNYPELDKQLVIEIQVQEERYKVEQKQEKKEISRALYNLKTLRSKGYTAYLKQKAETSPIRKYCMQGLPFSWNNLPDFVDADIPNGDWIFGCDRRLWQITIYKYFIWLNQESFSIKRVFNWLQSDFKLPPSVKTLVNCDHLLLGDTYSSLPSPCGTLQTYLNYLCELGMLEFLGNELFLVVSKYPFNFPDAP